MKRQITLVNSNSQSKHVFETEAETLGQLKEELVQKGINTANQTYFEGVSRLELTEDASILPTNIPYKGTVTNDLVIFMTTENKKISSGATRSELYDIIKSNGYQKEIQDKFEKNYTNVPTKYLEMFVEDKRNKAKTNTTDAKKNEKCEKPVCNCNDKKFKDTYTKEEVKTLLIEAINSVFEKFSSHTSNSVYSDSEINNMKKR